MPQILLKLLGAFMKSKAGKTVTKVAVILVLVVGVLLMGYVVAMFSFWNQFLCKATFGLFNDDCKVEEEVLVYEPVTEEDIKELGQRIYDVRIDAMSKVIDQDVIDFLKKYHVDKRTIDVPGEAYRFLSMDGGLGGGGKNNYGSGNYGDGNYHPSLTKDDYWEWAKAVAQETGWHPLLILSQWQQETGFKSANLINNNNLAGQTWHEGFPESMKGTPRPSAEGGWYVRYDNAVEGYIDFLKNNPRYKNVPNFATPEEQAAEVKRQGWATDPLYVQKLTVIIQQNRERYGDGNGTPASGDSDSFGSSTKENSGDKIVEIAEKYWKEMGEGQSDKSKRVTYLVGGGNLIQGGYAESKDYTQQVYKEAGITISGNSLSQLLDSGGESVDSISDLKPGDLVFFNPDKKVYDPDNGLFGGNGNEGEYKGEKVKVSHVGIYAGSGEMVHLNEGTGTISKSSIKSFASQFIAGKRWVEAGTDSFVPEATGPLMNEAEIHLRALNQADLHALNALKLTPETMEQAPFKGDTKIYRTWLIAQEMKKKGQYYYEAGINKDDPYYLLYKRSIEAEKDGVGQDWLVFNWLLYAQHEAYKCYMVGDAPKINSFVGFFMNIFGLGDNPCTTINSLYAQAGGKGEFIPYEDQGKIKHQHTIIEQVWTCIPDPPKPSDPIKGKVSLLKKWKKELFTFYDTALAAHNNLYIKNPKPNCGEDAHAEYENVAVNYVTYTSKIQILYDFEPYAMFETDVTVDGYDGTYKDLIDFILGEMYRTSTGAMPDDTIVTPSGDFIIPMENGTYNYSSGYGMRMHPTLNVLRLHAGLDMGTRKIDSVPIYATASGKVIKAGASGTGLGSVVTIDHMNGFYSDYGHMRGQDIVVREGQTVQQGQLLGGVGTEGTSESQHLHFEMCTAVGASKICLKYVDPEKHVGTPSKNQTALAGERAKEFLRSMKQRALAGEVILMPNFTPKESGGVTDKKAGAHKKDAVKGNVLGAYGFTEKADKTLYSFGDYLQKNYENYYKALSPYDPSSDAFVDRWKKLASSDATGFLNAQKKFAER